MKRSDFLTASEMRELLGVSDKTLARYRLKHWEEGVHYVAPSQRILYVAEMIYDWILNGRTNSLAHDDAKTEWLKRHQPKKRRG